MWVDVMWCVGDVQPEHRQHERTTSEMQSVFLVVIVILIITTYIIITTTDFAFVTALRLIFVFGVKVVVA